MSPITSILHICERTAWEDAVQRGEYRAASLDSEGFIHASLPEQVLWVANQFYRDAGPLILLHIDPQRLTASLQYDPVGEERFPHIYGPINLEAVVEAVAFDPDPDGIFRRLPGL